MAVPGFEGSGDTRGRRSPSPPYYRRRSPPRREWYERPNDGPHDYRSNPPQRRSSVGSATHQAGRSHPSERDRIPASTYRPKYDRRNSDHMVHDRHRTERDAEDRTPHPAKATHPVANKVWINPEYKRKMKRATQLQHEGAAAVQVEASGKPSNAPATDPDGKAPSTTVPQETIIPATEKDHRESSPMDLDRATLSISANQAPDEVRNNGGHGVEAERNRQPTSSTIPSTASEQVADLRNGQTDTAPASWLRPKRRRTQSGEEPTTPPSPSSPSTKMMAMDDHQGDKIAELLKEFFSASTRARGVHQELEKTQKLFAGEMKSLFYVHGSEEAATREANASSEIKSLIQKKHQLEGEASTCDEKSRSLARQFSRLINTGLQRDESTRTQRMQNELAMLRKDNEGLKETNAKLETRLSQIEASLKADSLNSSQLNEMNTAVSGMNSRLSDLVTSKVALAERIEKCETNVETLNDKTAISTGVDVHKLELSIQSHDDSLQTMQKHLDRLSEHFSDLKATVDAQPELFKALKHETLAESMSLLERNSTQLEERLANAEDEGRNLREEVNLLKEHPLLNTIHQRLDELNNRVQTREKEYSTLLTRIQSEVKVLQSTMATSLANMHTLAASGAEVTPTVLRSQPQNTDRSHNTGFALAQSQTPGGSWTPNAQQVAPSAPTNASRWQSISVPPMSPEYQVAPHELLQRIRMLEQFSNSHEHRLNYTTIESCWTPLVQHVMSHIGQHYRYPETVSSSLAQLQSASNAHSQNLADLSHKLRELNSTQQTPTTAELQGRLQEQSTAIESIQKWMQRDFPDLVSGVINSELEQTQQLRKDLHERMQRAMDEFKQVQDTLQARDKAADPADAAKVDARFTALETEFQDLERSCAQEFATLYGKLAGFAESLKGRDSTGDSRSVLGTPKKPTAQAWESNAHNGQPPTAGSSEESVRDSRRKRKRKATS